VRFFGVRWRQVLGDGGPCWSGWTCLRMKPRLVAAYIIPGVTARFTKNFLVRSTGAERTFAQLLSRAGWSVADAWITLATVRDCPPSCRARSGRLLAMPSGRLCAPPIAPLPPNCHTPWRILLARSIGVDGAPMPGASRTHKQVSSLGREPAWWRINIRCRLVPTLVAGGTEPHRWKSRRSCGT